MIKPLTPHAAALIQHQKTKTMVIVDLHIGWEIALMHKGIHVPTQTERLFRKLLSLIQKYKPHKVLILGDTKHTVASAEMSEWKDVPEFLKKLKKQVKVELIRGNHDGSLEPLLPEKVPVHPSTGLVEGDIGLFHGHSWPSPTLLGCKTLVMGHVHPVITFKDPAGFRMTRQVWVKSKCDGIRLADNLLKKHKKNVQNSTVKTLEKKYEVEPKTTQLIIMPAFNELLGGKPLNTMKESRKRNRTKIIGPVLRSKALKIEKAEIRLLDGTLLGSLDQLQTLS